MSQFPTSENWILASKGIQKFKEEKNFEIASQRCVSKDTETLKSRKKDTDGRWWTQKKDEIKIFIQVFT